MKKRTGYLFATIFVLLGAILVFLGFERPVRLYSDEDMQIVVTRAWQVRRVLAQAGIALGEFDSVNPPQDASIGWDDPIFITRASQVTIRDHTRRLQVTIPSRERIPANILASMGIALFPGDRILWNGLQIELDQPMPYTKSFVLQIVPARKIEIIEGDTQQVITSPAPAILLALWEAGIRVRNSDFVSTSAQDTAGELPAIFIQRAIPVLIHIGGVEIPSLSAAVTVGEAIAQAGLPLQGLDYSIPAADQPIPTGGEIQVVHVREEIALAQTALPFSKETVYDATIPLDQQTVLEPGHYGLKVSQERVRYENEQEVLRTIEAEWIAMLPKTQITGIGTQIVLQVVETPAGAREYWRSVQAYATSYSPCRLGTGTCNDITASGMKLQRGIIAVKCSWYSTLVGQQVYVPGYGIATIGDCGGGIPGTFWIDLGFSDEDYESWHSNVTLYFLTPVPATIPYDFP